MIMLALEYLVQRAETYNKNIWSKFSNDDFKFGTGKYNLMKFKFGFKEFHMWANLVGKFIFL